MNDPRETHQASGEPWGADPTRAWHYDESVPPGDGYRGDETVLTRRAITLAVSTVTTVLLVAVASVIPLPYAISAPGPTLDTLGTYDGDPLISIAGAPTYPSTGELRLTTVSVAGGERAPVSMAALVWGWFDETRTVLPVEQVIPQDQTDEEIDEQNQAAMISSQERATG